MRSFVRIDIPVLGTYTIHIILYIATAAFITFLSCLSGCITLPSG